MEASDWSIVNIVGSVLSGIYLRRPQQYKFRPQEPNLTEANQSKRGSQSEARTWHTAKMVKPPWAAVRSLMDDMRSHSQRGRQRDRKENY